MPETTKITLRESLRSVWCWLTSPVRWRRPVNNGRGYWRVSENTCEGTWKKSARKGVPPAPMKANQDREPPPQ